MPGAGNQCSEVARLLSQINDEYEAAQRGLSGLSYGTSRHDFITSRYNTIGQIQTQLAQIVGFSTAYAMIGELIDRSPS